MKPFYKILIFVLILWGIKSWAHKISRDRFFYNLEHETSEQVLKNISKEESLSQ
jgi:hypothetical protein